MTAISRIVGAMDSIAKAVNFTADRISVIEDRVREIASVTSTPTGSLTLKGKIDTEVGHLKQVMKNGGMMDSDVIQLDIEFSHAVYVAISPNNHKKIRELLSRKQVGYLRSVLENHKKLNAMADWAEEFMKKSNSHIQEHKEDIVNTVVAKIADGPDSVVSTLATAKKKLDLSQLKIDKALKVLDKKLEDIKNLEARMTNAVDTIAPKTQRTFRG